jgi:quinol monooxygenase YgiN
MQMNGNPKPITVVITCSIKPEKLDVARGELEAVIRKVMAHEAACHGIRVHDDPKNPHRLLIIEQWDSEEEFTGPHMQQPHMQAFLKTAETFLDGAAEFGFWRESLVA